MGGGRFFIDNNLVENAIRPLALGRKNFLFCGNHDAAIRASIVYSLVDSCKALDVDPREWMEDVLLRIPGNENNREALRELLPDKWAKQTNWNQLDPTWNNLTQFGQVDSNLKSNIQVVFYRRLTRFAQSMTRLSCRLLGASVPYVLPMDEEADELLESSLWDIPSASTGGKSLFQRRLGIISNLLHARRRYKVFYDTSSRGMILAYVRGYLFWGEE